MDKTITALIILNLTLVSLVILVVMSFVFFLFKRSDVFKQLISKDSKKDTYGTGPVIEEYCSLHKSTPSKGVCIMCERSYCSMCLKPQKSLIFCKVHFDLFQSYEWIPVISFKTTPMYPDKGIELYELKRKIWLEQKLPVYIETQYKINFEDDSIETFLALYSRGQDIELIKSKLKEIELN